MRTVLTKLLLAAALMLPLITSAQTDCQYSDNVTEPGKELKTTKDYLMSEKVFAGSSQFIFFSLSNSQGLPIVNFQLLAKSKDFPKVYCIDKSSKIYIQLLNGKIVTLISATEDQCGTLAYDEVGKNNIRILTGTFLFTKGSLEELAASPISFIRVKYVTETVDYTIKKELNSEAMGQKYLPDSYFINYLKCIQQ